MELSDMMPLLAAMNGGKGIPNEYKGMLELFQKKDAKPFELLNGFPGAGPEMTRLFKMMSRMGELREKNKGGMPPELLMELLLDGHPQFAQFKMMTELFQKMPRAKAEASKVHIQSGGRRHTKIADLAPIKNAADNKIRVFVENYLN